MLQKSSNKTNKNLIKCCVYSSLPFSTKLSTESKLCSPQIHKTLSPPTLTSPPQTQTSTRKDISRLKKNVFNYRKRSQNCYKNKSDNSSMRWNYKGPSHKVLSKRLSLKHLSSNNTPKSRNSLLKWTTARQSSRTWIRNCTD